MWVKRLLVFRILINAPSRIRIWEKLSNTIFPAIFQTIYFHVKNSAANHSTDPYNKHNFWTRTVKSTEFNPWLITNLPSTLTTRRSTPVHTDFWFIQLFPCRERDTATGFPNYSRPFVVEEATVHNTGINLLLSTSVWVLLSPPIERWETRPTA